MMAFVRASSVQRLAYRRPLYLNYDRANCTRLDPLQIILFGSQARGDADQQSDINLLVVFAELSDKRKDALDIIRTLSDLPAAKDILVSTPEELERHRPRIRSVLRYAQREGKVLYASD